MAVSVVTVALVRAARGKQFVARFKSGLKTPALCTIFIFNRVEIYCVPVHGFPYWIFPKEMAPPVIGLILPGDRNKSHFPGFKISR